MSFFRAPIGRTILFLPLWVLFIVSFGASIVPITIASWSRRTLEKAGWKAKGKYDPDPETP